MTRPGRRGKHQEGSLWLRGSKWYIRFYGSDGVQRTEFLAPKDDRHHSKTCKPVRDLQSKFMAEVNNRKGGSPAALLTVGEFWESIYLPWAKQELRPSTFDSYVHLWGKWLEPELGGKKIADYEPSDATRFLTSLASGLSQNTLSHVRALMSAIFSHACALGKIKVNPLRDAKVLAKTKAKVPTEAYTISEIKQGLKVLEGDIEAQCVFALAAVQALRPSEICGLMVQDVVEGGLWVRRAFVRGKYLGATKTEDSASRVPLIEPARGLVEQVCTKRIEGWLFPRAKDPKVPFAIRDFCRNRIKPKFKAAGLRWLGLYGGRRGVATKLVELTGGLVGAAEILRHSGGTQVLERHYKKSTSLGAEAMVLFEEELAKEEGE